MNQRIYLNRETASYDIRIENEVCTAVAPLRLLESETVIDVNQ